MLLSAAVQNQSFPKSRGSPQDSCNDLPVVRNVSGELLSHHRCAVDIAGKPLLCAAARISIIKSSLHCRLFINEEQYGERLGLYFSFSCGMPATPAAHFLNPPPSGIYTKMNHHSFELRLIWSFETIQRRLAWPLH